MTVKELRKQLDSIPEDYIVLVQGYEYGWWELDDGDVQAVDAVLNAIDSTNLGGPHQVIFDRDDIKYIPDNLRNSPKVKGIVLFHDEYKNG